MRVVILLLVLILMASSVNAAFDWVSPDHVQYYSGQHDSYPASNTVDGDLYTQWNEGSVNSDPSSDDSDWESKIIVDMAGTYNITDLRIYYSKTVSGSPCIWGDVKVCDDPSCSGESIIHQATGGGAVGDAWHTADIPDTVGRYVEIYFGIDYFENCLMVHHSNNGAGVKEIEVYAEEYEYPPNVTLLTPQNASEYVNGTNVSFIVTPSQGTNSLDNITLYIWNSTGDVVYTVFDDSISDGVNVTSYKVLSIPENYTWNYYLVDSGNYSAWGLNNFTLNITYPVVFSSVSLLSPANDSSSAYNVEVEFSGIGYNGTSSLLNATLFIWNSTGDIVNKSYNYGISGGVAIFDYYTFNYNDTYVWNYLLYDIYPSYVWASNNYTLNILNYDNPATVELLYPLNGSNIVFEAVDTFVSKPIEVDNIVQNCTFYLWNMSDDTLMYNITNLTVSNNTNNSFLYDINYEGNFSWNVRYFDDLNKSSVSSHNSTFTISISYTPPNITLVSPSNLSVLDQNTFTNFTTFIDEGTNTLNNITIYIWNSSNYLWYTHTNDTFYDDGDLGLLINTSELGVFSWLYHSEDINGFLAMATYNFTFSVATTTTTTTTTLPVLKCRNVQVYNYDDDSPRYFEPVIIYFNDSDARADCSDIRVLDDVCGFGDYVPYDIAEVYGTSECAVRFSVNRYTGYAKNYSIVYGNDSWGVVDWNTTIATTNDSERFTFSWNMTHGSGYVNSTSHMFEAVMLKTPYACAYGNCIIDKGSDALTGITINGSALNSTYSNESIGFNTDNITLGYAVLAEDNQMCKRWYWNVTYVNASAYTFYDRINAMSCYEYPFIHIWNNGTSPFNLDGFAWKGIIDSPDDVLFMDGALFSSFAINDTASVSSSDGWVAISQDVGYDNLTQMFATNINNAVSDTFTVNSSGFEHNTTSNESGYFDYYVGFIPGTSGEENVTDWGNAFNNPLQTSLYDEEEVPYTTTTTTTTTTTLISPYFVNYTISNSSVVQGGNLLASAHIQNGSGALTNWSVKFNNSRVNYTSAQNGSNDMSLNTSGFVGNYSSVAYAYTDDGAYNVSSVVWVNVVSTTTTTTTTTTILPQYPIYTFLTSPAEETKVYAEQNGFISIQSSTECLTDSCADVEVSIFDNVTGIIPVVYTLPFISNNANPLSCGTMTSGEICNKTFVLNATGATNVSYNVWVESNTTGGYNFTTGNVEVEILTSGVTVDPVIGIVVDYPNQTIYVRTDKMFVIKYNVTCSAGYCGDVNITLDPFIMR